MGNFTEYKRTYFGETKTFDCNFVHYDDSQRELVISFRRDKPITFLGIDFPVGSVSYGYYWEKRNYNVYHWKRENGDTLLIYFNISKDTRISKSSVTWLDLIVDIALKPPNPPIVLDEDEIPKNMAAEDLSIIEKTKHETLNRIGSIADYIETKTNRFV